MKYKTYTMEDALDAIIDYRGKTPKKSESGIPTLSAKTVRNNFIDYNNCYYISEEEYKRFMVRGFPKVGDILLTTEAPLGMTAKLNRADVALAQRLLTLRGKSDILDNDYLLYFLQSPKGQHLLKSHETGTTVTGIKQAVFRKLEISIPSITVQKQIAIILSSIDEKISVNTKINENLEQQAQALFKDMIKDVQEQVPFTSIIQVLGGGTPKTGKQEYWNGEIPFFTPKDVGSPYVLKTEKSITHLGLNNCNSRLYPVNTVFLTARGTVGKVSLAGVPMAMNQSCYALAGKNGLHQIIVYQYVRETVKALKHKASGAVFDAIITRDFDTENIPELSSEQIDGYIAVAEPIYSEIRNRTFENQRLATLRDTLLPKLMNGEIDVSEVKI